MADPLRLALSPLTKTIYAGRIKQRDGYAEAVGARHDVTHDFYVVLIQLAESRDGSFVITVDGKPSYEVTVKKMEESGNG
jgi:hypothetical protein